MLTVDQIIFGPFVIAMLVALIIFVIGIIYWFIYTTKRHKLHKSEKIFAEAEKEASEYAKRGLLVIDNEGLKLTEQGIDISNSIMSLFV